MGPGIANCLPWLLQAPLTAAVIVHPVLWFCRLTVCEQMGGVRSTDRLEDVHVSCVTYSPPMCQAQLAIAQDESCQLCKTLNDIEQLKLIGDPRLTAEGALQQVKARLAACHSQLLHE